MTDRIAIELELTDSSWLKFDRLCGYRERETPGPIPNPEAKPLFADNTAPLGSGNVGRRIVDRGFSFYQPALFINRLQDFF